jgi:flagella basal body P-ring formation protein FlgA
MLVATVQPLSADSSADSATLDAAERLTTETLLSKLTTELTSHFSLEGELNLELLRPWSPPAEEAYIWEVSVNEYPSKVASSMLVRCHVLADGQAVGEYSFVLRATLWQDSWSTRVPIRAQTVFSPEILEVRRVNILRERNALPASAGDGSFVLARTVSAGRLLTWNDIARRPLIRKGSLVVVSAIDGPLTVTLKALAMENGAKGDTITLRNRESRKDFSATVIDENRVQVTF